MARDLIVTFQATNRVLLTSPLRVDDVDGVIERLSQNGHQPSQWGPEHPHRKNVYFVDPDGLEFEFVEYFSQVPTEKNRYD